MPSVNVRVIDYNKYPYGSIFSKMVTVINYTQVLQHILSLHNTLAT